MAHNITLKSHLRKVGSNIVTHRALWTEKIRKSYNPTDELGVGCHITTSLSYPKHKVKRSIERFYRMKGQCEGQGVEMVVMGCFFSLL